MTLLNIIYRIVLPTFIIIGLGWLLDRKKKLDIQTLNILNFYAFVPALAFITLLESDLDLRTMGTLGIYCVSHMVILFVLSWTLAQHPALHSQRIMLSLTTIFYNAGNYGFPLIMLTFGSAQLGIIAVLLVIQNFLSFTFGVFMLETEHRTGHLLGGVARVPVIHAILLAIVMRSLGIDLKTVEPLLRPLRFLADGLIPLALLTLGVQLSRSRVGKTHAPLITVVALRLLVSPLVAFALVRLLGFEGQRASVIILSAGLPTAVNMAILASVYQRDENLASQAVFWTTLISAGTITVLLLLI